MMNAFNPIGGATIATIGMPTFITPFVELYANKNFMGAPIRYEDDRFRFETSPYVRLKHPRTLDCVIKSHQ